MVLSYRHGFHCGSHADVFKHILLISFIKNSVLDNIASSNEIIVDQRTGKLYPEDLIYRTITYVDSNAGAGLYSLQSAFSTKTKEYISGIGKVFSIYHSSKTDSKVRSFQDINTYFSIIQKFNDVRKKKLEYYPGSPIFAIETLKSLNAYKDAVLNEIHPSDFKALAEVFKPYSGCHVSRKNGLSVSRLNKLSKISKPVCILFDPSYEGTGDYEKISQIIHALFRYKKPNIQAMIWYPQINGKNYSEIMMNKILSKKLQKPWIHLTMDKPYDHQNGLLASGIFLINATEQMETDFEGIIGVLSAILGCKCTISSYKCPKPRLISHSLEQYDIRTNFQRYLKKNKKVECKEIEFL